MNLQRHLLLLFVWLLLAVAPVHADEAALATVRQASDGILAKLTPLAAEPKDPYFVRNLIETILLPHIEQQTIAERVLANNWQQATEEQRARFIKEFRNYMLNFYTAIFRTYSGEKVSYQLEKSSSTSTSATIVSHISQEVGQPIEARYRLERFGDEWKVTDVIVDGVSMVQSNRQQYRYLISRDGLDKVIAILSMRNSQPLR